MLTQLFFLYLIFAVLPQLLHIPITKFYNRFWMRACRASDPWESFALRLLSFMIGLVSICLSLWFIIASIIMLLVTYGPKT